MPHAQENLPIRGLTIDGPTSRDLDDAIWLHENVLTVCVPDVAAAIPKGAPIEERIFERGFTRYFANGNMPMLPRTLSEDRLSLLPDQLRRVLVLEMTLDDALDVCHLRLRRGILRSKVQLAYADVPQILTQADHPHARFQPLLAQLSDLATRMLEKRRSRGELALYDLRHGWAVSEEGQVRQLKSDEANIGYVIVQEAMLCANRAAAEWFIRANAPALYRNHRASVAAPDRALLLEDLNNAIAHPQAFDIEVVRRRCNLLMARARYSPHVEGHFGLNLPCYTHVTSPLRRLADLVNVRVMAEWIDAEQAGRDPVPPYSVEELAQIGDHLHQLVLDLEQKRDAHFREKAQQEAVQRLEHTPQQIASLPDSDFYRMLEAVVEAPEPPETLAEALRLRLARQAVAPKEVFFTLFDTPAAGVRWAALQQAALAYVATSPPLAVSLLSMGVTLRGWGEPRYRQTVEGMNFACVASQTTPDGVHQTQTYRARSKKGAQQMAAVALCHLHANAAPPVMEELPALIAETPMAGLERMQPMIEEGNSVGALLEMCLRLHRRKPRFTFTKAKKETSWTCEGTLVWDATTHQASATAGTKQTARRLVCDQLLAAVLPQETHE